MEFGNCSLLNFLVQALLAGVVGGLSAFFTAKLAFSNAMKMERVKRTNETLAMPVIKFINNVLELTSRAYWEYVDTGSFSVNMQGVQSKDSVAVARVQSTGNDLLVEEFRNFTHQFHSFRKSLNKGAPTDPDEEKKKLEEMAASLLRKLLTIISD